MRNLGNQMAVAGFQTKDFFPPIPQILAMPAEVVVGNVRVVEALGGVIGDQVNDLRNSNGLGLLNMLLNLEIFLGQSIFGLVGIIQSTFSLLKLYGEFFALFFVLDRIFLKLDCL